MFPNTQLNFPQAPKPTGSYKPLVSTQSANKFFSSLGTGIKNMFTPKPMQINSSPSSISGLSSGYKPLQLGGQIPIPPASSFSVPNMSKPAIPTYPDGPMSTIPVTQTTKTTFNAPTPSVQETIPKAPSGNLAVQGSLPNYNPNPPVPSPTNFGQNPISADGYINSSSLASNSTYADVLNKRKRYEEEYVKALMAATDIKNRGLQAVEDARYSGETQPFATGMTERIQRNADLASLAATNRAEAFGKLLGVNQQDVTNSLNAVATTQGIQTSPNGDVYSQTRDPITGETKLTSYGNIYNGTFTGQPVTGQQSSQSMGGGSVTPPVPIQAALGQIGSKQYIDVGSLSSGQLPLAQAYSAQTGIPLLKAEDASKIKEADATFSSASTLLNSIESLYKNVITADSAAEIPAQYLSKKFGSMFRTNTDAKVYSDTVQSFTSLLTRAAGEKGTLSDADKQAIVNSIPTFSDTVQIADKKMQTLKSLFQSSRDGVINSYLGSKAVSKGGGTIVQTKAGAINTDW